MGLVGLREICRAAIVGSLGLAWSGCGFIGYDPMPRSGELGDTDADGSTAATDPRLPMTQAEPRLGNVASLALRCASGEFLACHDFEGDFGDFPYDVSTRDGEVVHLGPAAPGRPPGDRAVLAMRIETPTDVSAAANIQGSFSTPLVSGQIFVRMRLYLDSNILEPSQNRATILAQISATRAPESSRKVSVDQKQGSLSLVRNLADNFSDFLGDPPPVMPVARWFCIELGVNIDTGILSLDIDGRPELSWVPEGLLEDGAAFERWSVGLVWSRREATQSLFLDDFAVSHSRIGCDSL